MKLYFEFEGHKLKGTECFSYQEAKFILTKILDQCMAAYKRNYNKNILGQDELILQYRILAKLKLVIN